MAADPTTDVVDALLAAVAAGRGVPASLYADDAVLDATVPGWRFEARGAEAVARELSGWYADPGSFGAVSRWAIAGGEVVVFELSWEEAGTPHAAHQGHVLVVDGGRIAHQTAFCGGRWPASLLARMEDARVT
jgi:hypothetical protein